MSSIKELYDKLVKIDSVNDPINYVTCSIKGLQCKKYIDFDEFDKFLIDVINMKCGSSDRTTEAFPLMMLNAYSVLYVDIDYFTTSDMFKDINEKIGKYMKEILSDKFPNSKIFGFIPMSYTRVETRRKCGFHGFVFCDEVLTTQRRKKIKSELLEAIENSELGEFINSKEDELFQHENDTNHITSISQLIDDQPLLHGNHATIIPFAKKDVNARNYKMLFYYNVNRETESLLVKPTAEELSMCVKQQFSNNDYNEVKEFNELRKYTPDDLRAYVKTQLKILHDSYSEKYPTELARVEMFLFDCMSGLSIMCKEHYIIQIFSKGSWAKNNTFIFKLLKFYYAMYIMTIDEIETELTEYFASILYLILSPLFIRGNKTDSAKIKEDLISCINYFANPRTDDGPSYFESVSSEDVANYKQFRRKNREIKKEEEEDKRRSHKFVKNFLRNQISEFVRYIREYIYQAKYVSTELRSEGDRVLKREIEPFKIGDYNREIENYSFEELRTEQANKKNYDMQIQNIIKLLILCETWESGFESTDGIIVKILSTLTSHYIYATKDSNSDKKVPYTIYIYNIKQSRSLESLPYNQWIIDNSDYLTEWLTNLYTDFIEPLQDESSFNSSGGIGHILRLIHDDHQLRTPPGMGFNPGKDSSRNIAKKRDDPKAFVGKIESNIIQFYNHFNGSSKPKVYEPSDLKCPFFSVRNGIIRYKTVNNGHWTYDFTTDNRDIILNAYTLAKYEPNYKYEEEIAYRELERILKDIYPDEQDYDYMMNLFATAFCPQIFKDQLLFAFGTGSDGKSTMSRLLGTILGNTSGELHVLDTDNDQITLKNPSGYCSSFKPQCLQESQNSGNANEGGIISFDRKTFVVAQEPPKGKIHSEIIKDFTSGGISNGRGLYKGNKQFVINTLCIIETNMIPQFDVVDDAVKRRVIVYKHNTKFVSSATNSYKNRKKENVKIANSETINNILQDTSYWTAMLMMMLRRVIKLRNTVYKDADKPGDVIYVSQLSHIPKPYNVKMFTSNVFGKTTGVSKYLQENLINNAEYGAIFLNDLIDKIIQEDKHQKMKKGAGILETAKPSMNEKKNEIKQVIQNVYGDDLFMIREELVRRDSTKDGIFKLDENKIAGMRDGIMKLKASEIVQKLTIGYSMETIEDGNDESYRDVIIVGVNFNENAEEEEVEY